MNLLHCPRRNISAFWMGFSCLDCQFPVVSMALFQVLTHLVYDNSILQGEICHFGIIRARFSLTHDSNLKLYVFCLPYRCI